ncbi:hypothetical protein OAZ93_00515 [Prochlorococcus sp. AH-736-F09]|nr:hypothetical protein [Prochlorococcus sp. AH-736-F09]
MSIIRRSKAFIRVLGINFAILGILFISPAIIYHLYIKVKPKFVISTNQTLDKRALYPTYTNNQFSIELLNEFSKLPVSYRSFIGWRREKVNFKYTNILGPYKARKSKGESINNSVWFFGGSTMWGTGSSDTQTIPSHFNSLTNIPVYNFGETNWNSRQSLNQLINAIGDNHYPSVVIFYDGINDVMHQCRSEIQSLPAHEYETRFNDALGPTVNLVQKKVAEFVLAPYINFSNNFIFKSSIDGLVNSKEFNCDTNQEKARLIAQHLVNNWRTAYALSITNDFKFYGILQPTLFSTKTNTEYFSPSEIKKNSQYEIQFKIVYPLILKEIERNCEYDKNFCSSIINGADWLDGTNNIFIDFSHINSLGNKEIAQRLKSLLKKGN